jgi:hypothetical protein
VNNELEGIWKEVTVAYLKIIFRHLPRGIAGNHGRLVGVPTKIRTCHFPDTRQNPEYSLSEVALFQGQRLAILGFPQSFLTNAYIVLQN